MTPETALKVAAKTAEGVLAARDGDPLSAAAHLIGAAMELVTPDVARQMVNDEQVRKANAAADEIRVERFGPESV